MIIVNQWRNAIINFNNVTEVEYRIIEETDMEQYSGIKKEDIGKYLVEATCVTSTEVIGMYVNEKLAKDVLKEILYNYGASVIYKAPDCDGCPFIEGE